MVKTAIFLSAREKATRLPGKQLKEIHGRTVTEHIIDRIKTATEADLIVLTTSVHPDDKVLCDLAERNDIKCFQGSEDDKLERYRGAANHYDIDFMVIVDGDDVLCDPVFIDKIILRWKETRVDFVYVKDLPLGCNSNGMTLEALEKVCKLKAEDDTEVWGGYFLEGDRFQRELIEVPPALAKPDIRLTLDYQEDFEVFSIIFDELYGDGRIFPLEEVVALFEKRPELKDLNKEAQKRYEEHLKKSAAVKFKDEGNEAA